MQSTQITAARSGNDCSGCHPAHMPPPPPTAAAGRRPSGAITTGILALAGTVYTGLVDPNTSHAFPLCPLKLITGIDCPFCGCLRSVHSLTRGRLAEAANHNLLFVLSIPLLVAYWVGWLRADMGLRATRPHLSKPVVFSLIAVAASFTVARNLPIEPLHWLNSTAT